jgi:hypothetical protein
VLAVEGVLVRGCCCLGRRCGLIEGCARVGVELDALGEGAYIPVVDEVEQGVL